MNPFTLDGRRALITGGTSGIGLAMAKCYLQAGAEVVVTGRRRGDEMAWLKEELGPGAHYRMLDMTDSENMAEAVRELQQTVGDIDILVNNAGNHMKKPLEETTDSAFLDIMQVHVLGAFALSRAIIPQMKRNRRGVILFQASMASYIGVPGVVAYASAKSAVLGLVRSLAAETSGYGIRVNGIAPGWIQTPMLEAAVSQDKARADKILGRTPLATFGAPEDIGWAGVYLASDAAKFVNGVVLPVDGGALIGF